MEAIYLICLLVGGFFVLLSMLGGGDTDADVDFDGEIDVEFETEIDGDFDTQADTMSGADMADAGPGLVDLLSVRALFLFAAFFGLTGTALSLLGSSEPMTAVLATVVGLVTGLGGNYIIKRVGYAHISSDVESRELKGMTGKVVVPFDGQEKGKISLVARGHRLQIMARAFENQTIDTFRPGDDVVVVRFDGAVAEVVKPE